MTVGDVVEEYLYVDVNGQERRISEAWRNKPALVLWLRHFGCRFFQESALDISTLAVSCVDRGLRLVVVVQGTAEEAALLASFENVLTVPDPTRRSYVSAGLGKTTWRAIFFPNRSLRSRRKSANARGCAIDMKRTKMKSSDPLQLPGAALVDQTGTVRWFHNGRHTGNLDTTVALLDLLPPIH